MTTLAAVLVDSTIVIAAALAICLLVPRQSAARRHAMLAAAVAAVLLVPALELLLPQLPVFQRIEIAAPIAVPAIDVFAAVPASSSTAAVSARADLPWIAIALQIWLLGALLLGVRLATGWLKLARVRSRCLPASSPWRDEANTLARRYRIRRAIGVLQSDDPSLLVTSGVLRPSIILPAGAAAWPADRIRNVLLHELAHIRRHDVAIQAAAELLRAAYWINPLIWIACRRLRQESEQACDDAVLREGVAGDDYASDLLAIATQLSPRAAWSAAPAIAHPSTLERRIAAMLQRNRNRAPLGVVGWMAAAVLTLGIAVPVVAAGTAPDAVLEIAPPQQRPTAAPVVEATQVAPIDVSVVRQTQPPPPPPRKVVTVTPPKTLARVVTQIKGTASLKFQVVDQLGGVIPGAKIALTDTDSGTMKPLITTSEGGASIEGLAGGRYEIAVSLPGFTTVYDRITLAQGGQLERTYRLPIGTMTETVTVSCPAGARWVVTALPKKIWRVTMPVVSAQERPRLPVRVGGAVRVPIKEKDVKPVCPPELSETATIKLSGRLGVDGRMHDLAPQPDLPASASAAVEAARAAVSQWTYRPAMLNGVPIDVNITVVVTFAKR